MEIAKVFGWRENFPAQRCVDGWEGNCALWTFSLTAFSARLWASQIMAGMSLLLESRTGAGCVAHNDTTVASTRIVARRITCPVCHARMQIQGEKQSLTAKGAEDAKRIFYQILTTKY